MTIRLMVGLVANLCFLLTARSASACSCDVPPVDVAIGQADVIFSGPLTRMEVTDVVGVLRAIFQVREPLKGQAGRNFIAYTHRFGGSCLGYDFRVGHEYIVFAIANDAKGGPLHMPRVLSSAYVVYLCSGTADLQNPTGTGNRRLYEVRQQLKPKR
jgi:hypothetical protein